MVELGNLGGFGGLVKGLTSLMPQDDPTVQAFAAQSDVNDLRTQESDTFAEIGRCAVRQQGTEAFGELGDRLRLVQSNLSAAEAKLNTAQQQAEAAELEAQAAAEAALCPSCGCDNPEGTKFCRECGTRLGAPAKTHCVSCGAALEEGTRFCGECGARQGA